MTEFLSASGVRAHGGVRVAELQQLGIEQAQLIDFSVSTNHMGPNAAIAQAVAEVDIHQYPDPECWAAREALAVNWGVEPPNVGVGNGAAELIWLLARLYAGRGRKAVIVTPTFGEFEAAVRASGGEPLFWRAREEDTFAVDFEELAVFARQQAADCLYVCAPMTPVGGAMPLASLVGLADALAPLPILLDEAFLSLSETPQALRVTLPENVIRIRSMTKEWGIAGVRVGYLLAQPRVVTALETQRPPWTVSAAAQAAILAAQGEETWLETTRCQLLNQKRELDLALGRCGLTPHPSSTLYLAVRLPALAHDIRQSLLREHHVMVRDCASFGLPYHMRVSAQSSAAVAQLESALGAVL